MPTIVGNSLSRMEPDLREVERLCLLRSIVWSQEAKAYDDIVRLAHTICGTPIALITMVGKREQWLHAKFGIAAKSTPREGSFCQHTLCFARHEYLEVEDALLDSRFCTSPLVQGPPYIRYYLGYPIISPEGVNVGALCVIDTGPRKMSAEQKDALRILRDHLCTYLSTPINWLDKAFLWLRGVCGRIKLKS